MSQWRHAIARLYQSNDPPATLLDALVSGLAAATSRRAPQRSTPADLHIADPPGTARRLLLWYDHRHDMTPPAADPPGPRLLRALLAVCDRLDPPRRQRFARPLVEAIATSADSAALALTFATLRPLPAARPALLAWLARPCEEHPPIPADLLHFDTPLPLTFAGRVVAALALPADQALVPIFARLLHAPPDAPLPRADAAREAAIALVRIRPRDRLPDLPPACHTDALFWHRLAAVATLAGDCAALRAALSTLAPPLRAALLDALPALRLRMSPRHARR